MARFVPLRRKLLRIVMLTTLAALLFSLAVLLLYDLRQYRDNLEADMRTQAELLGRMSAPALSFDDKALAAHNLGLLRLRPQVLAAAIYNERGEPFSVYHADGVHTPLPERPQSSGAMFDGERMALFLPIQTDGQPLGAVYLEVKYAPAARIVNYLALAFVVLLAALAIAYLLLKRLQGYVTDPLTEVAGIAREVIGARNYAYRAGKTGNDEIGMLVDAFNDMLAEIERRTAELVNSNEALEREALERGRAQQEVLRLNAGLEQRVRERTRQLEAANLELAAAKEIAEHASRSKSAFLSSMSHELRTPLNAILGFSQILLSDTLPTTDAQKRKFGDHILKAGRHLLTLINEILDLAKIESGAVTLSLEHVDLDEILLESRDMVEPLAAGREIAVHFPPPCGLGVHADRTRLRQVMLNLLSNAVKYNRPGGTVKLTCARSGADKVRIEVSDSGKGLDSDQLANLFQPFNRLGQEGGPEEGSGIGLVVTKRLVESMGGAIGVASTPGAGSTFWIELKFTQAQPLHMPAALAELAAPSRVPASGLRTVLCVEDNPANLKLIEELIRFQPDLRLLTATEAFTGVELAVAELPEVILMDINLPGMSGLDALRHLRADPRTQHIPVIALTANAMPRDVQRGLEAGFFRYITKPIIVDEFFSALNAAIAAAAPR